MKIQFRKNNSQRQEKYTQRRVQVDMQKEQDKSSTQKTVDKVFSEAVKHYEPALRKLSNE